MVRIWLADPRQHPDWITQRQDGSREMTFGENNEIRVVHLNPIHPAGQTYMLDLVREIIQKYPVDGIQLDDHFGLPVEMGYDPYTIARYGRQPPTNSRDPHWMRWRAQFLPDCG